MKRQFVVVTFLCLLAGCVNPNATRPLAVGQRPVIVKGTYTPGSYITEPRPQSGKYVEVKEAGFEVSDQGVYCYVDLRTLQPIPPGFELEVRFHSGYIAKADAKAGHLRVKSSEPVKGLRSYVDYPVQISVLSPRKTGGEVLKQSVRSYVDNTSGEVRIFSGYKSR